MNPNIDKQEIRSYLLGTLKADGRIQLEERILCDPEVYEELLLVEEGLIDQYVAGGLSQLEKHQFETHFLVTAERQKNLRFGKLLKRYLNSQPASVPLEVSPVAVSQAENTAPAKKSFPIYLAPFRKRPVLAFSATLVAIAGIVLLCLLATRKPVERTSQPGPNRFVVVSLAPGSMRSGGATKRVTVPPKGVDITLELEVANTTFHNYKSQLFRESQPLEAREALKMEEKGDHHIVPVPVTGEILSPGDYQVRLSGVLDSGQDEFIDNYSFRVTTE